MTRFFINRKTLVAMVFTALCLLGFISYTKLPVELMPNVESPYLLVNVSATREMNPQFIEREAVIPVEGALGTLEGVTEIESQVQSRGGTIYLTYDENTNINYAYIKLTEKIGEIAQSISEDFTVTAVKVDTESLSNMFMRLQVRGGGGLERVRAVIDKTILNQLQNIDGIANVSVTGGQVKSVEIVIDNDAAEASNITPGRIRSLIASGAARKAFVGHAYENDRHYFVNVTADYTAVSDLENIIVNNTGPVFLKDIADITFGLKEEESISRVNGKNAVTVQLIRDANVNLIDLSHKTREVIDRLNKELAPQDVQIVIQSDTAEEMENNINLIKELAVVGGLLSILILWFFLRNARLVLIVLLAIPISILTACNFFYMFGISINSLTLVGMALAVGMLLDNGVVVLENIYRNVSIGRERDDAVITGTFEVRRSIIAATLTTITVFLPFSFASDSLVRVIGRHIGVSIISTLVVSLIVAVILVPAGVHALLSIRKDRTSVFARVSHRNRLVQIYTLLLKSAIRFPARTVLTAMVAFFLCVAIALAMSLDVASEVDLSEFNLYVTMPTGSTLERTDGVTKELEERIADIEEIQDVICTVYEEEASVTLVLKEDFEKIKGRSITSIKSDIQHRIENFRSADVSLSEPTSSRRFGGGGGGGGGMMNAAASLERMFGIGTQQETVLIKGNDFDLMQAVADDIQYQLDELDTISSTSLNVSGSRPEVHLLFDRMLMSRDNISLSTVSTELSSFSSEMTTTMQYQQGTDEYDIVIRNKKIEESKTYEDLSNLAVYSQAGGRYDMSDISTIVRSSGRSNITRVNQEKQIELTYRFISEVNDSKPYLESARTEVEETVAAVNIPAGVAVEIVHDESNLSEFYFLIGASFLLIFMILASVFESVTTPVVMMFTIPLATIGSFGALILTGNSIKNANSLIGFLILLGVVVNNGIILIDYTRLLRTRGFRISRALMTAGQARVRPILITTITTIVAMIPLAMGKAEYVTRIGAPFAITVIGGLMVSTLFTLVFIPTVYAALETSLSWLKRLSLKLQILQSILFAIACAAIWQYVDNPLWQGAYVVASVIGIPASVWFVMTSLRRAQAEFIAADESLAITIRRVVKIYDGDTRFVREWKKGERLAAILGGKKESISDISGRLLWQFMLLAFFIYFVYIYLENDVWLFILSHGVYFFGLVMISPVVEYLRRRGEETGKASYTSDAVKLHYLYLWSVPAMHLVFYRYCGFKLSMLIFIGIVWYSALSVWTTAEWLNHTNINIMRLTGRFAGLRRIYFQFVRIIPIIGRRKKPFNALDGVSMTITNGMFGLLGPNGAGKTTIMRIICGVYDKTMGTVRINDMDFTEKREELQGLIGYLPQEFGTYENMTAFEFLDYIAILKGMYTTKEREERVAYCLGAVHLSDVGNRKIGSFSGGMKQRMGIAMTLIHLPRILVVDEPTAGLDPRERIRFRNLLVELSAERIVIFSTHIIEDISSSCNRVAVIDRGSLRYLGDPQNMTDAAEGHIWQFNLTPAEFDHMRNQLRIVHHMRSGDDIRVRCLSAESPYPGATTVKPTLEDAYLWLLGTKKVVRRDTVVEEDNG